jgi:energy-coupling factor transporter ATP-binding protein EcfA2
MKKRIIQKIIKHLTKAILWLKSKDVRQASSVISLAPKILKKEEDIRLIQPYLDELKCSLVEENVTNIAITGTYGSGKSTIIKTFQHLHPEYEYLNISLAAFRDNEENRKKEPEGTNGSNKSINNELERRLEISILQQIFYYVKPFEIPDSRFKRIINIKGWHLLLVSLSLIIWIISTFILFKFDYINTINPSAWDTSLKLDWFALIALGIFFTGIGFFTKYIVRLFSNSKINKFSIKGELELGNKIDKSVFNEHLEEIIYFFERTPYNVVIIEDLDRFETTDIFTKLRELNILLNTSKLIKREINFVYAINDELFKYKDERVKFFDYIIPVIPFINASNAGVKLIELIKTRQLENVLTRDFIQDIVSFIDDIDMRLLINIFNEFCVYRNNIHAVIQDNLFAMIVYKNMYPDDFGKLSKKGGNLYGFISKKNDYISDLITTIDSQVQIKKEQIEKINNEKITSEKELRAIYINAIHEKIPEAIYLLNERLSFAALNEDEHFEKIKENKKIFYFYCDQHNRLYTYQSTISFSDVENHVNPNFSYDKRKQFIQEKHDNKVEQIKQEIESLISKKKEIEQRSLQEIFQEVEIKQHLGIFSNNQMIRTLLINGYLNEDYEDYITLFHEGNISRVDEVFKRKIKSGIESPFSYSLSEKVENLVKEIPDKYFKREIILNFDLLDFLSTNYNQHKLKYDDIIHTLSSEKESSVSFIEEYIERGHHIPLFIKSICRSWSNWWEYIYKNGNVIYYHDDKLKKYLKLIIECAETNDILQMNKNSGLFEFINTLPDFISLIDIQYESKTKKILKELKIRFKRLALRNNETELLFDYVYENDFYEINEENICLMLSTYYKDIDEEELKKSHYSTILKSNCKSLIHYIETNISVYVKEVFSKLEENTEETEETVIKLLNNTLLSNTTKTGIALKQKTLITDISAIQDIEIQQILIENNKIVVTWNNLYLYYETLEEESGLDETLINFLNDEKNYTLLFEQAIRNELSKQTEETIKKFSLEIINCNDLKYKSYIHLLNSIPYRLNSLNFEHLDEDKVKWMVATGFLNLTVANFSKLKDNFPNEHLTLIEKQPENFIKIFDEFTLDEDDVLSLLKSEKITNDSKVGIIEKIDNSFIIDNKNIAKSVCDILTNSKYIPLNIDVIESIINSSSLLENRIKVLNKQEKELNDSQIQGLIEAFGEDYKKLFIKQSKPKFSKTDYHEQLFDNLKKRKLIRRFEPYKDNRLKVIANY